MRQLTIVMVVVAGLMIAAASAWAIGMSPSRQDYELFPNDIATIESWWNVSSADPVEVIGYGATIWPDNFPQDFWVSLERDSLVTEREVFDPGVPPSVAWYFPLYMRNGSCNAELPMTPIPNWGVLAATNDSGGGGGITFQVGVLAQCGLEAAVVEVPKTVWQFHNTSSQDIVDGVLLLQRDNAGSSYCHLRYVHGLTIPAGGSLIVEAQMAADAKWSFGAMLDGHPVFAFDDAGNSPAGQAFDQVFTDTRDAVPDSGLFAAIVAEEFDHTWHRNPGRNSERFGFGQPSSGYITFFAPPVTETTAFSLYSFSDGELVGAGSAEPESVAEPSALSLVGLGLVGLVRRKRRS